ncbi:MAG: hypothetical protein AAF399_27050 [Bacteroidota bacterium]
MSRINIYSLLLGLSCCLLPGWLSAQSQIEPFFRLGNTSFGLDEFAGMTNTGAFGSQIGAHYLHGINGKLQLGTGLSINSYGATLFASDVSETYAASLAAPYAWEYSRTATGSRVDERIRLSSLQIPIFVNYFFGDGTLRPYARLGVGLNVPLSATYQIQNEAASTVSYSGIGSFPRENPADGTFTAEIFGLVKEESGQTLVDFDSDRSLLRGPQDLEVNSTFFSLMATLGAQYQINDRLNASFGLHVNQNTNVSGYNAAVYNFSTTGGQYTSLLGRSEQASTRFIGVHAGLAINLEKPPCTEEIIPIRWKQLEANRRQPNRPDPEFATIAREVLPNLNFQPNRWNIRYDPISGGIVYCVDMGPISEITVNMKRDPYLRLDPFASGTKGENFEVLLAMESRKDVVIQLRDADTGNPIQDAPYVLSMGSIPVMRANSGKVEGSGQTGVSVRHLPAAVLLLQQCRRIHEPGEIW